MVSSGRLVAFAATAFVVIVIPGPSVLFAVGRALANGRRVAVLSVLGNALGEFIQVIGVGIGIGALVEQSVAAFTVVKLVGGCYLIYLGFKTFKERRSLAAAVIASQTPPRTVIPPGADGRRHQPQDDRVSRRDPAAVRQQIGGPRDRADPFARTDLRNDRACLGHGLGAGRGGVPCLVRSLITAARVGRGIWRSEHRRGGRGFPGLRAQGLIHPWVECRFGSRADDGWV
jgi:hypothetical protein